MDREIALKHVDAALAQVAALHGMLQAMRQGLVASAPKPTARPALAERCAGIAAEKCAIQSTDAALAIGSFGDPNAWRCAGCGFDGSGAVT